MSRGVEHDPEAEPQVESSKKFDLKNRFSFGNVPTANFFKSPKENTVSCSLKFKRAIECTGMF